MDEGYPGRTIKDQDRSPFGLGWEYRRRGWTQDRCPLPPGDRREDFRHGHEAFRCSDRRANQAMLRGIG